MRKFVLPLTLFPLLVACSGMPDPNSLGPGELSAAFLQAIQDEEYEWAKSLQCEKTSELYPRRLEAFEIGEKWAASEDEFKSHQFRVALTVVNEKQRTTIQEWDSDDYHKRHIAGTTRVGDQKPRSEISDLKRCVLVL